jgi:hypothetical protein
VVRNHAHRIASHRIASHRIASHRIASHRIALAAAAVMLRFFSGKTPALAQTAGAVVILKQRKPP